MGDTTKWSYDFKISKYNVYVFPDDRNEQRSQLKSEVKQQPATPAILWPQFLR